MAIGWLTVLQSVPWGDVVNNAPKVAAGAKKLWSVVGKKKQPASDGAAENRVSRSSEVQGSSTLQSRLDELEAVVADLQGQLMTSSALINELADQNTQLILRIETLRKRLGWLAALVVVIGLVAASALVAGLRAWAVL